MAAPIDFYFEFSSPYAYLAALEIDELGARHAREVVWKPFLLGAVFKTTGQGPLLDIPVKGEYAKMDLRRAARFAGVPFVVPKPFPFAAVSACRAFYWLTDRDPGQARALALEVLRRAFGEGLDMSGPEAIAEAAVACGLDGAEILGALRDPAVKDRLRAEVEAAEARGVFGSPFVIVEGQQFWGHDRLGQVEQWLETGGW